MPLNTQTGEFSAIILPTIVTDFSHWSDPFGNDDCEFINDTTPNLGNANCEGGAFDGTIMPNGQYNIRTDWTCSDVEIFGSTSGSGIVQ